MTKENAYFHIFHSFLCLKMTLLCKEKLEKQKPELFKVTFK